MVLLRESSMTQPAIEAVNLRSPLVRWQTRLVRTPSKNAYGEPANFQDSVTGRIVPVTHPALQAALDALAAAPCTWTLMCERAQLLLAKHRLRVDADPQFERDFATLWQMRALIPQRSETTAGSRDEAAASGPPGSPSLPGSPLASGPLPPERRWAAAGE
jgi:hypothetical protein